MDHFDGLFAHGLRGLFEVKILRDRHVEDVILFARAARDKGLEDDGGVKAHGLRHRDAVDRHALFMRVGVRGVGDLLLLQNAHDVGFFFFILCHKGPPMWKTGIKSPQNVNTS